MSAATGVSGLEAGHAWYELDLTALLTLNDLTADPCYKLIEIPGFFSTPDLDDNRHPKSGTFGEEVLTSFARGKSFEYHGVVQGTTRDKVLIGKTALMGAFGPKTSDGAVPGSTGSVPERRMVITPSAANVDPADPAPAGNPHTFVGVCRKVTMDEIVPRAIREEGRPPFRWSIHYVLEMRITDGFFYQWDAVGHTQSLPKFA